MADERYGPWDPLDPTDLRDLLQVATPWWLMGGVALDRFVGHATRPHDDVDVEIPRPGLAEVLAHLAGWSASTAHHGRLTPLVDAADQPDEANGVWWRSEPDGPWRFDLKLADVDGDEWVYRRHPEIRRPLDSVWWLDVDGVPVIAPEVQLLFKARAERPKDTRDAEVVVPSLDVAARAWLRRSVAVAHPSSPWMGWL